MAVSYILVAQLGTPDTGLQTSVSGGAAASAAALCQSGNTQTRPSPAALAKCGSALEHLGAQHQRDLTLTHLLQYSLITLGVVTALAAILGWIFAGRALRPVHRIAAAALAASEENLSARVALRGPRDELRELADTFDGMLDRLQLAFEGQQQFIANASHELRTPLTVMRTSVDVVAGNPDSTSDDLRAMAGDIRTAVDHADHLIGALLLLARNQHGLSTHEVVDLATVVEDVLDVTNVQDRRVHMALQPALISGDPMLIERLVANLMDNAVRYNVANGEIWVITGKDGGSSRLTVTNTGAMINPADAEHIFEPFRRLSDRTTHEGFGMGLAIVASITSVHGGSATARSPKEGGLSVTITIPGQRVPGECAESNDSDGPQLPLPS